MNYYAHTAEDENGNRLPEASGRWQLLKDHLRNVADLARHFAEPLGLADEAELAGLLHDLGKYSERFQARLRNPAIHGINHWAAGATHAARTLKQFGTAFAVDGHHTGVPALGGAGLQQTVKKMSADSERVEFSGCAEGLDELLARLEEDGVPLPELPRRAITDRFAEALRTRMLFPVSWMLIFSTPRNTSGEASTCSGKRPFSIRRMLCGFYGRISKT